MIEEVLTWAGVDKPPRTVREPPRGPHTHTHNLACAHALAHTHARMHEHTPALTRPQYAHARACTRTQAKVDTCHATPCHAMPTPPPGSQLPPPDGGRGLRHRGQQPPYILQVRVHGQGHHLEPGAGGARQRHQRQGGARRQVLLPGGLAGPLVFGCSNVVSWSLAACPAWTV